MDLRTFMPLDFDGSRFGLSFSVNRGDFAERVKPSASMLFSNRWDTDHGEFGILVDVAHSELATRTDGLFVRPFFDNANSDLDGDGGADAVWLPRGADWRTLEYERERQGAYVALQWRPNERLDLSATAFQSRYDELWFEDAIFVQNDPRLVALDASQPYRLDGNVFVSGRLRADGDIPMGTDIRASHRRSRTSDYSFAAKWRMSERTELSTDLQFIKATTRALDSTVALGLNVPWIDVDLGGGVPASGSTGLRRRPASYYWAFTMDHHDGPVAWRPTAPQLGAARSRQKFGVRVTDRDADNIDTGYDWQPVISRGCSGGRCPATSRCPARPGPGATPDP